MRANLAATILGIAAGLAPAPQQGPASQPAREGPIITASTPLIPKGSVHERPPAGEEPKVVFEALEHNYGVVEAGSTTPFEFAFRNEGKGPLKIVMARPACSCVLGGIEVDGKPYSFGQPIPPGVRGILRARIMALWQQGDKNTHIDVLTNDPSFGPTSEAPFGHLKLHVVARIVRPIEWTGLDGKPNAEGRFDLGGILDSKGASATVALRNVKGEPFEIVGVDPTDPKIRLTATPLSDSKTEWRVEIDVDAGLPLGPLLRQFTLRLQPEIPGTNLFVVGRVHGAVDVEPPLNVGLRLPMPGTGAKGLSKITLRAAGPAPLALKNLRILEPTDFKLDGGRYVAQPGKTLRPAARAISDALTVTPVVSEAGKVVTLEIGVKPTMPKGFFHAMLVFETGLPGGPAELAIPVTGFGR